MIKAVITADIVNSSALPGIKRQWLYEQIEYQLKQADSDFGMISEMYRGDSFQCLVTKAKNGLRSALVIKTFIRSLNIIEKPEDKLADIISSSEIMDIRLGIGIGEIEERTGKIVTSDGKAFQLSGKLLDEMKNSRRRFGIASDDAFMKELKIESMLLDAILSKTTAFQCEVINLKLLGYTETEIARRLNINQAAVNQRSVSGNWNAINKMVQYFENLYTNE